MSKPITLFTDRETKSFPLDAHYCLTATGFVVWQQKLLLVLHNKLKIWLAPGGHLEKNEVPHVGALREVEEETGLKTQHVDWVELPNDVVNLPGHSPTPFLADTHWICEQNYLDRKKSGAPAPEARTPGLPFLGCEAHFSSHYLMTPIGEPETTRNMKECDDMDWFSLKDLEKLELIPNIRAEATYALTLAKKLEL